jgi:NAD-dependent DNA ligase
LDDIDDNKEVQIKRIVHFFETTGVPRLRQKTAEKMWESGLTKPEDIVKASVDRMMEIKGIGKKTASEFYNTIRNVLRKLPPDRFIVASTTFKAGVGRKLLKELFRSIPNILNMNTNEIKSTLNAKNLKGFGPKRISTISEGIPEFKKYLDSFAKDDVEASVVYHINKMKRLEKEGYNKYIEGKKFVLTGFYGKTDYQLEDYIYDNMGDFATTVTSDVEAVICGNIIDVTKKMMLASDLGVKILAKEEFFESYEVPRQT